MTFNEFWMLYPRHDAKKDAQKAWDKLNPSPELQARIAAAVVAQRIQREAKTMARQWVPEWPYPASWLRGERWTDEVRSRDRRPNPVRDAFEHGAEIDLE